MEERGQNGGPDMMARAGGFGDRPDALDSHAIQEVERLDHRPVRERPIRLEQYESVLAAPEESLETFA